MQISGAGSQLSQIYSQQSRNNLAQQAQQAVQVVNPDPDHDGDVDGKGADLDGKGQHVNIRA